MIITLIVIILTKQRNAVYPIIKFNVWLNFILVQFLISLIYKMNFDFDFIQILSMRNKFIACFADRLLKLLVQSIVVI